MFSVNQQDTTFIQKKIVLNHLQSLNLLLLLLCNLSDQKLHSHFHNWFGLIHK